MAISEQQLTEWERLANEATEGPWYFGENTALCQFHGTDNARFICAAREAVPALIAELRKERTQCLELYRQNGRLQSEHLHMGLERGRIKYEAEQLEKEAEWLAEQASLASGCHGNVAKCGNFFNEDETVCTKCWRQTAREACHD